ncbi:DUF4279 domain-containing protein [Streptosporangium vulgare]|uniref:DUF4279 domain-containing protein n=1 Tax=Streptosporangium vulgare TaxID=46190 RepID=A0ABV5TRF0_9ACTN
MFKISLRLVSDDGDPAQVSAATGMVADHAVRAGDRSIKTGKLYKFSSWSASVGPKSGFERPEEAFEELVSWGLPTAYTFRKLKSESNWEISLVVVQEFRNTDNPMEKGVSLNTQVIEWIAAAGAGLEIDQYVYY